MSAQSTVYEAVFSNIMAQLESGVAPWRKPWSMVNSAGAKCYFAPINVISGEEYRGANALLLSMASAGLGFTSNVFGTYKQWQAKSEVEVEAVA